ncbi:hypothetical protein MCHI_003342 [Candidatus Magnetoovum chiemensis]|nr:hypothetical protein MCHI_003342 [Candidatus Magnetoovum chiemensis]
MATEESNKITHRPDCPYCGQKMKKTETPPFNIGEGLGWCEDFLYICFNDECSFYSKGWEHIMRNYGKTASYRCMCYPSSGNMDAICVYTPQALTGQIVEDDDD